MSKLRSIAANATKAVRDSKVKESAASRDHTKMKASLQKSRRNEEQTKKRLKQIQSQISVISEKLTGLKQNEATLNETLLQIERKKTSQEEGVLTLSVLLDSCKTLSRKNSNARREHIRTLKLAEKTSKKRTHLYGVMETMKNAGTNYCSICVSRKKIKLHNHRGPHVN